MSLFPCSAGAGAVVDGVAEASGWERDFLLRPEKRPTPPAMVDSVAGRGCV